MTEIYDKIVKLLDEIQIRWSSSDPTDRYIGILGKVVVEGSAALLLTVVLSSPLFIIDTYVTEIDPFFTQLTQGGIPLLIFAFLINKFYCDIILDLRRVEDESPEGSG